MNILINIGLILTYVLLAVSLIALLFFSIKFTITNISKSKSTIFGFVGFAVLFILSYLFSSSTDVSTTFFEKTATDPGFSKLIGSGLILTYFMFVAVVGSTIYAAISKLLK